MRNYKIVLILFIAFSFLSTNAQEKKIKFNKGTLKICSAKSFVIEGYDGDEVIIESLHEKRLENITTGYAYPDIKTKSDVPWVISSRVNAINNDTDVKKSDSIFILKGSAKKKISYAVSGAYSESDSDVKPKTVFFKKNDSKRERGLKKLGQKNKDIEDGIYFIIEQRDGELIFKDDTNLSVIMSRNKEQYKIKIPNSIKLDWQASECNKSGKNANYFFFNSEKSSLSNFDGEVAISSSVHNVSLLDVTGPVSINTIGGNVTVKFDKKTPRKLYSIYSNNGFIDITLPRDSNLKLDATASDIFSDIDFTVEQEDVKTNLQHMKLKLNKGSIQMKLNANLGNIYLRKK
jgi:hypothetical protein